MNFEEYYSRIRRIKIIGGIVIGLLAIFWAYIIEVEPSLLFKCLYFPAAFGSTAWAFAQPFIWLAKWQESIYTSERRTSE